ncbi:3-oxoacyl-[acyl-carrier-protein] synthase III C-terminal domain-containing protein [Arenicellales bacterium IMCC56312]|jgi:3-oxoacyl-[acyl-carrier-protein] synthase III
MEISSIGEAMGDVEIDMLERYNIPELVKRTGIPKTFQSTSSTVELAARAVRNLIAKEEDRFETPNLLILVTQTPDDLLPANAISLANALKLPNSLLAIDLNQGCSGFVQALAISYHLLTQYKRILLVTADRYRSKLAATDRSTQSVFSDGAAAVLLSKTNGSGILMEDHVTFGSLRNLLFQSAGNDENDGFLHMAGADVWLFTAREVAPQINRMIKAAEKQGLTIRGVYLHQASKLVVDGLKRLLNCSSTLIQQNYDLRGNTVSSSIPLLIKDRPLPDLGPGEAIIFAGFGVGLTSSVLVYGNLL